jgi:opacity protein-like surface antigen
MQKRIPLFVVVMIVVGLCTSAALAFGPYGPPMSTLEHGQWAWDIGYTQEEFDMVGCDSYFYTYADWDGDANEWEDASGPYGGDECFRVLDLETQAALASIEYGLCDNWDIFFRLGMAKSQGDIAWRYYDRELPYWFEESVDFDWGLAWQVGTNFTICQQGPWTWGGRMQFGMADPDSDSWTYRGEDGDENGGLWTDTCNADIEMYQALAYIGPSYQPSDGWLLYSGIGWQCVRVTMDYNCEYLERNAEDSDVPYYRESESDTGKLKHYSAIGLIGAAWMPNDRARVSADVLIGEAGKIGWSIAGQFPF